MSQAEQVLAHLKAGHSITPLEALGVFRIYRLADVIFKLRSRGHRINTRLREDAGGKTYAEYFLAKEGQADVMTATEEADLCEA